MRTVQRGLHDQSFSVNELVGMSFQDVLTNFMVLLLFVMVLGGSAFVSSRAARSAAGMPPAGSSLAIWVDRQGQTGYYRFPWRAWSVRPPNLHRLPGILSIPWPSWLGRNNRAPCESPTGQRARPDSSSDERPLQGGTSSAGSLEPTQRGTPPGLASQVQDRQAAAQKVQALLAAGGDLVASGITPPRLVAEFRLEDIEALVRAGFGLVLGEVQGQFYKVVPLPDQSFLDAGQFVPLTDETRHALSNRGLQLNAGHSGIPANRAAQLTALESRLRGAVGAADAKPIFHFFPTVAFDYSYLQPKQAGVLRELGLSSPTQTNFSAVTVGVLVAQERPAYVIHSVQWNGRTFTYTDPESVLVTR